MWQNNELSFLILLQNDAVYILTVRTFVLWIVDYTGFSEGDELTSSHPAHSNTPSPLLPSQARHSGMTGCQSVPDVNTHNKVSALRLQTK